MIKATRNWGGLNQQGRAFGYLEGGRGVVAASIGAAGVLIFSLLIPEDVVSAQFEERQSAFRWVIWVTSASVAIVGTLVYLFLKEGESEEAEEDVLKADTSWETILRVMQLRSVRLLILIVLCAYCGYKVTDILSLYAADVMNFDEVDAAKVGSFQMYLRPIVCISIGFLLTVRAVPCGWSVGLCCSCLVLCFLLLALLWPHSTACLFFRLSSQGSAPTDCERFILRQSKKGTFPML